MIGLVDARQGRARRGLPARDRCALQRRARAGAWVERDGERTPAGVRAGIGRPLRMVGSRSHHDPLLQRMQEALGITDVRPSGSVGIKCALIAERQRDLYIHPVPYLKEWDTCAPEMHAA